jgi:hypothetical protein
MTITPIHKPPALITEPELRALNAARTALASIEAKCQSIGYTHTTAETDEATRFYCGRLAERCEATAETLFQVLNSANAYGLRGLTADELHNRGAA